MISDIINNIPIVLFCNIALFAWLLNFFLKNKIVLTIVENKDVHGTQDGKSAAAPKNVQKIQDQVDIEINDLGREEDVVKEQREKETATETPKKEEDPAENETKTKKDEKKGDREEDKKKPSDSDSDSDTDSDDDSGEDKTAKKKEDPFQVTRSMVLGVESVVLTFNDESLISEVRHHQSANETRSRAFLKFQSGFCILILSSLSLFFFYFYFFLAASIVDHFGRNLLDQPQAGGAGSPSSPSADEDFLRNFGRGHGTRFRHVFLRTRATPPPKPPPPPAAAAAQLSRR